MGLLAGEWKEPSPQVFDAEWDIIAYDLGGLAPVDEILAFKAKARETWLSGRATVFYPHFTRTGWFNQNTDRAARAGLLNECGF